MVSEVSVHGRLAPLLWVFDEVETSQQKLWQRKAALSARKLRERESVREEGTRDQTQSPRSYPHDVALPAGSTLVSIISQEGHQSMIESMN